MESYTFGEHSLQFDHFIAKFELNIAFATMIYVWALKHKATKKMDIKRYKLVKTISANIKISIIGSMLWNQFYKNIMPQSVIECSRQHAVAVLFFLRSIIRIHNLCKNQGKNITVGEWATNETQGHVGTFCSLKLTSTNRIFFLW